MTVDGDTVRTAIHGGARTGEVMLRAEEDPDYRRIPGDDGYSVYRGRDLLVVGTPGNELYVEDLDTGEDEPDPDPVAQDPWDGRRVTVYRVQDGARAKIKERVYRAIDEAGYLFDGAGEGAERYVERGTPHADVTLRGDRIVLREWGDGVLPALDDIDALEPEGVHRGPSPGEDLDDWLPASP